MTRRNLLIALVLVALIGAKGAVRTSWGQKASVPKHQDTVALGHDKAVELLLVMDPDKNGKVSKQAWMKFMEGEFDRLDQDKKGELDPRELQRSNLSVSHYFRDVGK
jgi:hypothetical protein